VSVEAHDWTASLLRPLTYELANGLRIRLLPDHDAGVVAFQTFFRVGSRDERVGRTGIAHLFEHMMFNGATRYGPKEFDAALEARGGSSNAYTSNDLTVYHEEVPAEALDLVIDLESDRLAGLRLSDDSLQSEREVVKEERRMRVEDSVFGRIDEELSPLIFQAHPYRWPVIGFMSDLDRITLADCREFFGRYYAPDNATVYIGGDFDPDRTLRLIEERYGAIPRGPGTGTAEGDDEPEQRGERRSRVVFPAQTPALLIGYRAAPGHADHSAALDLIQMMLGVGEGSLLVADLVHRRHLCTEVSVEYAWRKGPGVFMIAAELPPNGKVDRVVDAIQEHLDALTQSPAEQKRLAHAKAQMSLGLLRELSTSSGRAHSLGNAEHLLGGLERAEGQLARVMAVTRGDVQDAAQQTFSVQRRCVVSVQP
jgi:predicted Zn-dependent peptidase